MVKLRGYADAAFAIHCEHKGSGKSQYTECFDLILDDPNNQPPNSMFYFRSIRPTTVDLCATEAEMSATVEATKTALQLQGILLELNQTSIQAVELYNDNQPNIPLSTQPTGHSRRVRYMLPKLNWMID
jgi:hypothetical protein